MTKEQYRLINELIRREVVPATGCTEPACVALAVAYAASILPEGSVPESIEVSLSANMLKNAMGVGIPGTGMIGVPIAIALGLVLRCPERQLEVLDDFSPEKLAEAKAVLEQGIIQIRHIADVDKLYAEVRIKAGDDEAISVIEKTHTSLSKLMLNGVSKFDDLQLMEGCSETLSKHSGESEDIELTFDLVYDYATTAPLEDLHFIYEAALQNKRVSEYSLQHKYGHGVGRMIQSDLGKRFIGDSPMARMLMYTSSACDARMDGAPVTVMSNSGSGNQGITATLPVLTFAEQEGASVEATTRALMMSGLMVVYIKQLLGRLSCLCGMVVSGIGSSAALVYLMGGTREQSGFAIKNMVGNVTGMICDGAKPSCSLKASTGISSAMISALLAMESKSCSPLEGIVASDVDSCIVNLALIGRDGMEATDLKILGVMTSDKK